MLSSLHLFLKVTSVTPEAEATSNCLLCSSLRINDKYKIAPANPIGSFLPQFHLLLNRAYNLQHVFLYSRLSPFYLQVITYPNLGHVFYPSSRWFTEIGPIQQYVLADLYAWLAAHSGFTNHAAAEARMHATTTSNSTAK
jgi:hypothetical protein